MSLKKEQKQKEDVTKHINKALENIEFDRNKTLYILMSLIQEMNSDYEKKKSLGLIAAKHLEILTKSNDQLIKIINILSGKENSNELSEEEKNSLYDVLQKDSDNIKKESKRN